jgi:hypothetical protein
MKALLKSLMFSNIWGKPQQIINVFMKKSELMEFREFLLSLVQNLLSSSFLFNIKIYKSLTLPVVLYGRSI